MKKLLLIICVCIVFSCKKDNASENITAYNWVLKAQIISPAITIDGKTSTDYLSLQNPEGCTKNFAYAFLETGIFTFGSNGALCDMIANTNSQKWKLEEDQITLDYGNGSSATPPLKVNEIP